MGGQTATRSSLQLKELGRLLLQDIQGKEPKEDKETHENKPAQPCIVRIGVNVGDLYRAAFLG
jgi:hypothetical protein